MTKLNQVLAVDKSVRDRVTAAVTELHHATQKPTLMNGFVKTYQPLEENGEDYPPEQQKVQFQAEEVLSEIAKIETSLFDITATKDWANCGACADLVLDGRTLLPKVPVTHLLFLEKQLVHLNTLISKMVELDPGSEWELDPTTGLQRTQPIKSQRTKKVPEVITKAPATKEHPAQAEIIVQDKIAGTWTTVKLSGAIPTRRKKEILTKLDKLSAAIKFAREHANSAEAQEQHVGKPLFDYLFGRQPEP